MDQLLVVEGGGLEAVIEATQAHGELSGSESRIVHQVSAWSLGGSRFLLVLPPETHAYDLCNLVTWLGDPGNITGVVSCHGWFRNSAEEFYLEPDPSRAAGDTLRGVTSAGRQVALYLPEVILAQESNQELEFVSPPQRPAGQPLRTFGYDTEELGEAMNPRLLEYSAPTDIPVWSDA